MTRTLLLAQAASTLPLIGLIWTVQVVQYPLFNKVGEAAFSAYHAGHSQRITVIVIPLMFAELFTAMALVSHGRLPVSKGEAWLGLALVGVVWMATALLQVPRHRELALGFEHHAYRMLVLSNWVRTVAWSLRGALVLMWLNRL
ncbi:MAG: hypothetical protein AAF725_21975 [Acidobacteriota bacterium]